MDTMRVLRRWAAPMTAVLVVVWFWYTYSSHARLKQAAGAALAATHRPYLLNGTQVRLDRYLSPAFQPEPRHRYYLAFVSSDSCKHSQTQARALLRWLERTRAIPPTLLISFDEGSLLQPALVAALSKRNVPYQRLRIRQQAAFTEDTGLAGTPAILILDSDLRVRLVAEGLSPAVEARIAQLVNEGAPSESAK
jgi:hypothetical protein